MDSKTTDFLDFYERETDLDEKKNRGIKMIILKIISINNNINKLKINSNNKIINKIKEKISFCINEVNELMTNKNDNLESLLDKILNRTSEINSILNILKFKISLLPEILDNISKILNYFESNKSSNYEIYNNLRYLKLTNRLLRSDIIINDDEKNYNNIEMISKLLLEDLLSWNKEIQDEKVSFDKSEKIKKYYYFLEFLFKKFFDLTLIIPGIKLYNQKIEILQNNYNKKIIEKKIIVKKNKIFLKKLKNQVCDLNEKNQNDILEEYKNCEKMVKVGEFDISIKLDKYLLVLEKDNNKTNYFELNSYNKVLDLFDNLILINEEYNIKKIENQNILINNLNTVYENILEIGYIKITRDDKYYNSIIEMLKIITNYFESEENIPGSIDCNDSINIIKKLKELDKLTFDIDKMTNINQNATKNIDLDFLNIMFKSICKSDQKLDETIQKAIIDLTNFIELYKIYKDTFEYHNNESLLHKLLGELKLLLQDKYRDIDSTYIRHMCKNIMNFCKWNTNTIKKKEPLLGLDVSLRLKLKKIKSVNSDNNNINNIKEYKKLTRKFVRFTKKYEKNLKIHKKNMIDNTNLLHKYYNNMKKFEKIDNNKISRANILLNNISKNIISIIKRIININCNQKYIQKWLNTINKNIYTLSILGLEKIIFLDV